jgi:hypothetical protein
MPTKSVKASSKSIYDVHPGVAMVAKWVAELPQKTGRSVEEWSKLILTKGPKGTAARRDWLKKDHGLGTNNAWWLVDRAEGRNVGEEKPEVYLAQAAQYVREMYSGGKLGLRPIHDALFQLARGLGKDIKICPCKTIVPIYRNHVIAEIKPSTRTRIDLGFALGDLKATGRLIDTGGFAKKDRITHRIPIGAVG